MFGYKKIREGAWEDMQKFKEVDDYQYNKLIDDHTKLQEKYEIMRDNRASMTKEQKNKMATEIEKLKKEAIVMSTENQSKATFIEQMKTEMVELQRKVGALEKENEQIYQVAYN